LRSFGSKAIVDEVQKLFPGAVIGRYDSDNTKNDSFSVNYESILNGDVDIIIGTQQLVKGLDLPLLSTVGVLDADLSLNFPDYSSEERTFQLLSQVSGRVGRGHMNGDVCVQTFQPNNPVIQLAIAEDWHAFRDRELKIRKEHIFPPFTHTMKLIFRNKDMDTATQSAQKTKEHLSSTNQLTIDGPLLSYYAKRGGYYYVQLHLKSMQRTTLLECITKLSKDVIYELDPLTLL